MVWRRTALCACRQLCCTLDFSYLYDVGAVCNQACKWPDMYLGNLKSPHVAALPLQTEIQVSDTWLLRACSYIKLTYASLAALLLSCTILSHTDESVCSQANEFAAVTDPLLCFTDTTRRHRHQYTEQLFSQ